MYPRTIARRGSLRIPIVLTICGGLLLPSNLVLLELGIAQTQSSGRGGRPRPGKPEGTFPDLEDVKRESGVEREPAPPIPSIIRSPKNPLQPWNGIGDPGTRAEVGQISDRRDTLIARTRHLHTRRAHASRTAAPPTILDEQFIANFFNWAVLRAPTGNEPTFLE